MKSFQLSGEVRPEIGKKASKNFRKQESIPCVLYGGEEVVHFNATFGGLRKLIYTPEVFLVELTIGEKAYKAIVKDLQFHPLSDAVLHVDFLEINDKKPVVIDIPVVLRGLAEGVKAGGKLSQEMRKLKIKANYDKIPENLTIDVSDLGLGKTIQVGALTFPGLEILSPAMNVVAAVKLTRAAKGAAASAAKAEK